MIDFPSYSECTDCPLCQSATNPGLPTRQLSANSKSRALLIVGEAPSYNEDRQTTSWVGHSGAILTRFIDAMRLTDYVDVFLSNACRCRPPQGASGPTAGQVTKCRPHLQADMELLCSNYCEVIILCCGAKGTLSISKQSSLTSSFNLQGYSLSDLNTLKPGGLSSPPDYTPISTFYTYHPAILIGRRKPALVTAVHDHFSLIARFLSGNFKPKSLVVVPVSDGVIPDQMPPLVCVDIETYGILKGQHQSVFHPIKSLHIDGIPLGNQVVTVCFGYPNPPGSSTPYTTCVYDAKKHKAKIRGWFKRIVASSTLLIGQNIKFDLQYLRANDPLLAHDIDGARLRIDDLLLASFLWYEHRPEKGLKQLATLFGITDYSALTVTGSSSTATSASDPALLYYNALDVATTLSLYDFTWSQIKLRYGSTSAKLSALCSDMRNQVLWDVINLESAGCALDFHRLTQAHYTYLGRCDAHKAVASAHNLIISGPGTVKSTQDFLLNIIHDLALTGDSRITLTEKKREISVGQDNFNLLLGYTDPSASYYAPLLALKGYHEDSKIVDTYTSRLITINSKGTIHYLNTRAMAYPSWYPIPSQVGKAASTIGGTIQGRFSAKQPPAQTFPPLIKKVLTSRYLNGHISIYDLSQIELRIAALLSGDPIMLNEYLQGTDRHTNSALLMFPDADPSSPTFRSRERQLGKTINFLIIYRGGALCFQETAMKDLGIPLTLDFCQDIINKYNRRYSTLRRWQDSLIDTVRRTGYLELPTGWSRTWGKGQMMEHCVSEICDFPVQTIAAQLLQSAQYEIDKDFRRLRLSAQTYLQSHDSLFIDSPTSEIPIINKIMDKWLTRPPLLGKLEYQLGRTVPILYEKEN